MNLMPLTQKGAIVVEMTMPNNPSESLLLSASQAAALLGIGRSHFYSLHSSGRIGPLPVRLGRRTLWRRDELMEWTRKNCPSRDKWLAQKQAG